MMFLPEADGAIMKNCIIMYLCVCEEKGFVKP